MNKHIYPEMKYLACAQHKTHYIGSCQQCINTSEQANHQAAEERANIITFSRAWASMQDTDKQKIINLLLDDIEEGLHDS